MPASTSSPTPSPSAAQRLGLVLRFPVGMVVTSLRYLWRVTAVHRREVDGDVRDLPPALPEAFVDDDVKTWDQGRGPLFHRTFAVRIRDAEVDAAGLMSKVTDDLDAAAPSEVVSFRKERGTPGHLVEGDEYRVRMPGPWDGPVRVVRRDATSFRFATLARHLEAGQIEFRAVDGDRDDADDRRPGELRFEIEAWSRAGDPFAQLLYHRLGVGKEVQLNMWLQFCLSTVKLAGGRRRGGIVVDTRRVEDPTRFG